MHDLGSNKYNMHTTRIKCIQQEDTKGAGLAGCNLRFQDSQDVTTIGIALAKRMSSVMTLSHGLMEIC